MANSWNTIHIFLFGIVQVITDSANVQAPISAFQTAVDAVVDEVWSKKPADNTGDKEYHAVNAFNNLFVDWQSVVGSGGYRTPMAELDKTLFDELAASVLAYQSPVE